MKLEKARLQVETWSAVLSEDTFQGHAQEPEPLEVLQTNMSTALPLQQGAEDMTSWSKAIGLVAAAGRALDVMREGVVVFAIVDLHC